MIDFDTRGVLQANYVAVRHYKCHKNVYNSTNFEDMSCLQAYF